MAFYKYPGYEASQGWTYTPLSECRSGPRGVSRGSRGYFGSPGGFGYYHLKGLEKLVRFIYPIRKVHGKMPRNHNFRFWI